MDHSGARGTNETEILSLERVDFQRDLLTDISKTQAEFLMSTTLDSLDKGKELVSDIVAAWHTGNTTVSEQLLLRGLARKAELLEFIVTERNALWVPQL